MNVIGSAEDVSRSAISPLKLAAPVACHYEYLPYRYSVGVREVVNGVVIVHFIVAE